MKMTGWKSVGVFVQQSNNKVFSSYRCPFFSVRVRLWRRFLRLCMLTVECQDKFQRQNMITPLHVIEIPTASLAFWPSCMISRRLFRPVVRLHSAKISQYDG